MIGSMVAVKASDTKKEIVETRTRTYLDKIPLWDERKIFNNVDDAHHKEFLFTAGYDRKEMLDLLESNGFALVYSPRYIIQKGHFFDLIHVKIGNKNVTGIVEVFKRKPSPFEKLPDCMNGQKGYKMLYIRIRDLPYQTNKELRTLDIMRKITAIGLRCMENHGVVERKKS